jgi:FKBP-type peptidyl-prolyl cis-trans isomerase
MLAHTRLNGNMKLILGLLAAATLAGCTLDTGPSNKSSDPSTETFAASLGVDISTMTKTTAGDYYKDIKVGPAGAPVLSGNAIIGMDYTGYIKNGSAFATGSIKVSDTQQETLANLILGLQDAMQGMAVGGERLIVVPSQYAYGATSFSSNGVNVPPNSTLIFDITLTGVQPTP